MRTRISPGPLVSKLAATAWVLLCVAPACALEDNPGFDLPGQAEATGGGTTGDASTSENGSESTTGDSGTTGVDPGCTDPSVCIEIHVGPASNTCTRMVDGAITDDCDLVGYFAFRVASEMVELAGGGRIVLHDNKGVATEYGSSIDLVGGTTVTAAPNTPVENITIESDSYTGPAALSITGDGVHLGGFTIAVMVSGGAAIRVRADPDTPGSETGGHLFERLNIVATLPEELGSNSIGSALDALGPDTTLRNSHIWGYFNSGIDLRWSHRARMIHNTFCHFQTRGEPDFDVRGTVGVEITNNVFLSLTRNADAIALASATSDGLVVTGNAAERYATAVNGAQSGGGIVIADNLLGEIPVEAPHLPQFLADASISPSGTSEGVSLDGVDLDMTPAVYPGAFQLPSARSGPRRTTIRVGDGDCGGDACDRTQAEANELRLAVHDAWPGSSVEIYPSATPYHGAPIITWPVNVRGMGATPAGVVINREIDDDFLAEHDHYASQSNTVVVTWNLDQLITIENLTIEVGAGATGMRVEGSGEYGVTPSALLQRLRFVDDGDIEDSLANRSATIGDGVVFRDSLVRGAFCACARFGPRRSSTSGPAPTTAWIHHLTCRLLVPSPDPMVPIAGFEVASANGAVIADVALEMAEPGALFKAQRRFSSDDPDLDIGSTALDVPTRFHAQAISALGAGADYDGFGDADGTYTLVDIDGAPPALFVGPADDHLDAASPAIDGGIDPATLNPNLSLGTDLDGVDRAALMPDRGAYEQGQ